MVSLWERPVRGMLFLATCTDRCQPEGGSVGLALKVTEIKKLRDVKLKKSFYNIIDFKGIKNNEMKRNKIS